MSKEKNQNIIFPGNEPQELMQGILLDLESIIEGKYDEAYKLFHTITNHKSLYMQDMIEVFKIMTLFEKGAMKALKRLRKNKNYKPELKKDIISNE